VQSVLSFVVNKAYQMFEQFSGKNMCNYKIELFSNEFMAKN